MNTSLVSALLRAKTGIRFQFFREGTSHSIGVLAVRTGIHHAVCEVGKTTLKLQNLGLWGRLPGP